MYKYRRLFVSILAGLLIFSFLAGFIVMAVNASKTVGEIEDEIDELQAESDRLAEEREALELQIEETKDKTLTIVEQKAQVDMEIELTRKEVENVNDQIHHYNLLIAEKQAELDELKAEQQAMFERYQTRMRAMQERGEVSIWEVMLQSKSFEDMLNCRVMIEEIAAADQKMMDNIREMAANVLAAKDALAAEKVTIEIKKAELAETEKALEEKRAESDKLLAELNANRERLIEECEKYEEMEANVSDQIASLEAERTEILYQQWLEEQKRLEQEQQNQNNNSNGSSGESGSSGDTSPPASSQSFKFPMEYCTMLTSSYGYRVHPITGNYSFHNGVDLAAGSGTPIYALSEATQREGETFYVSQVEGGGGLWDGWKDTDDYVLLVDCADTIGVDWCYDYGSDPYYDPSCLIKVEWSEHGDDCYDYTHPSYGCFGPGFYYDRGIGCYVYEGERWEVKNAAGEVDHAIVKLTLAGSFLSDPNEPPIM